MKLSDLHPDDVKSVDNADDTSPSKLKLSDLHPDDVSTQEHLDTANIPQEQYSPLESFGRGTMQGATLGLGDEIAGGLKAGTAKVGEELGLKEDSKMSLKDLYKMYRDAQRAKNKQAEEQNPKSYLAGNVTGGIGSAIAAPEALMGKGAASAIGTGAVTGLGTSEADLTEPSKESVLQAGKDTAMGGAIGAAAHGFLNRTGNAIIPKDAEVAYNLGNKGVQLYGEGATTGLKKDAESLANYTIEKIKAEKSDLNSDYNDILEANKDKSIDLHDFVEKLDQRANEFDATLPEQAKDKEAVMKLIKKVTEGTEYKKDFPSFKQGKTYEAIPSARETLTNEAQKEVAAGKSLGQDIDYQITPQEVEGKPFLVKQIQTKEPGAESTSIDKLKTKAIPDTQGTPAYSDVTPTTETKTFMGGGSMTPSMEEAKKLRTSLGSLANERNLSAEGQRFADSAYADYTKTLKSQVPDLAPTDEKYSAILSVARKLGIKGNDEDIIKVLANQSSENQGKEILINQALGQLDKVNPKAADQIRTQSSNLDQKANLIQQINKIGNYNVLNPKQMVLGAMKDAKGLSILGGNVSGLINRKIVNTPIGKLIEKSLPIVSKVPHNFITSPFVQETAQNKLTQNSQDKATNIARNLYTATDDSLKDVAGSLKRTPGLEFYGDHLNKAIEQNNNGEKDRIIFLILQNPKSRKLVTPSEE